MIGADEAFREENGFRVFVIAGCGIRRDFLPILKKRCAAVERGIREISAGSLKHFHAKELMALDVPLARRTRAISQMSAAASSDRISKFAVAFCSREKVPEKWMRDNATSFFMLLAMELASRQEIVPKFEFDRTQYNKKNGWIEKCFTGIKRFPIFMNYLAEIQFLIP